MNKEKENLLKESTDFIANNLDCFSDKVPVHLLDSWCIKEESDMNKIIDTYQWTVFIYALLKYKERSGLKEFQTSIEDLLKSFETWQLILGCAEVSRITDVKTKPMKLFDFDNYSKMSIEIL